MLFKAFVGRMFDPDCYYPLKTKFFKFGNSVNTEVK